MVQDLSHTEQALFHNKRRRGQQRAMLIISGIACASAPVILVSASFLIFAPEMRSPLVPALMLSSLMLGHWILWRVHPSMCRKILCWYATQLRPVLESRYSVNLSGATCVGIMPGYEFANYDGDTSWDVGFLVFAPGIMTYYGDRCSFELVPEQLENASVEKHPIGNKSVSHVHLSWRESQHASPKNLMLEIRDANAPLHNKSRLAALANSINEWAQHNESDKGNLSGLGLPPLSNCIEGKPLPQIPNISFSMRLLIGVPVLLCWVLILFILKILFGRQLLDNPIVRYGGFVLGPFTYNLLVEAYLKRKK